MCIRILLLTNYGPLLPKDLHHWEFQRMLMFSHQEQDSLPAFFTQFQPLQYQMLPHFYRLVFDILIRIWVYYLMSICFLNTHETLYNSFLVSPQEKYNVLLPYVLSHSNPNNQILKMTVMLTDLHCCLLPVMLRPTCLL